jgi:hypothetical protein
MENVQFVSLNQPTLLYPDEICSLLLSESFYRHFKAGHILWHQSDVIIRKQIPPFFFQFHYVGGILLISLLFYLIFCA